MAKRARAGEGQRALQFEKPSIPADYDEVMARRAAKRRFHRAGELALSKAITAGFRTRTNGLWVPYSRAENTAVVSPPDSQLIRERIMTKERVKEKYQDSPAHQRRVERWAGFAAQRVYRERVGKFEGYFRESKQHLIGLETALDTDRTYSFESILGSHRTLSWMREYAIGLRGFNDHRWVMPHWTHQRETAMEWADEYIGRLGEEDLTNFYDEAVWSVWGRKLYWYPQAFPPNNYDPTQDPRYQVPIEKEEPPPDPNDVEYYDDANAEYYSGVS